MAKRVVTRVVVTHSTYGIVLHFSLSMFVVFVKGWYTFKHNWNGFCYRKKDINIHIVCDHTYVLSL